MKSYKLISQLFVIIILSIVFFACEKDDENLTVEDTVSKITDGYVLFSFIGDETIHLIDSLGNDVKTWTSTHKSKGGCYLSENKTLLRLGSTMGSGSGIFSAGGLSSGILEELDDNSNVLWSIQMDHDSCTFHHDFKEIDENTIIVLSWELREYNNKDHWNENVLIIDKISNTIIWKWSALDDGGITPGDNDKEDYLHFNAVDYKDGAVLISSRSKSTVYLIDKESKTITAELTAGGFLSVQHDASFLDNGNILIFNNEADNKTSSAVVEISTSDEIIWQYANEFYSNHISGAQRLASGNTLICSGVESRLIEVTSNGEEVWDYSPKNANSVQSREIFKVRKYSEY
jgi:DNA-binding beta-propeller fold protein YncE